MYLPAVIAIKRVNFFKLSTSIFMNERREEAIISTEGPLVPGVETIQQHHQPNIGSEPPRRPNPPLAVRPGRRGRSWARELLWPPMTRTPRPRPASRRRRRRSSRRPARLWPRPRPGSDGLTRVQLSSYGYGFLELSTTLVLGFYNRPFQPPRYPRRRPILRLLL
jgi:hypothetical protein